MKKIVFCTIVCALFLTSCDDFLDMTPPTQADAKLLVGNSSDAQVIMNGIMRRMIDDSYYGRLMILYADSK